jgi:hypothetical protein
VAARQTRAAAAIYVARLGRRRRSPAASTPCTPPRHASVPSAILSDPRRVRLLQPAPRPSPPTRVSGRSTGGQFIAFNEGSGKTTASCFPIVNGAVRQRSRGDAHGIPVRTHPLLHEGAVNAGRLCSFVALIFYASG